MSINIHAIAAGVLAESVSPDPGVMADEFVARLNPEDYREALVMLARSYMRGLISQQRATTNGGAPMASGSRKVDAARAAWKRLLDTPEFVPSSGWLFLRDATAEQVLEMAGMRKAKAKELTEAAKRYQAIAQELRCTSTLRVGDLPDGTLAKLLGEGQEAA